MSLFFIAQGFPFALFKMVCNVCGNPDGPCRAKTRDCSFFISELLVTSEDWMVHFNTLFFVFILCFCEIYFADFPFYHCTNVFFLFYIFFVLHVVHYTFLSFGRMFHAMLGTR